jgi:hypothetical protein
VASRVSAADLAKFNDAAYSLRCEMWVKDFCHFVMPFRLVPRPHPVTSGASVVIVHRIPGHFQNWTICLPFPGRTETEPQNLLGSSGNPCAELRCSALFQK